MAPINKKNTENLKKIKVPSHGANAGGDLVMGVLPLHHKHVPPCHFLCRDHGRAAAGRGSSGGGGRSTWNCPSSTAIATDKHGGD